MNDFSDDKIQFEHDMKQFEEKSKKGTTSLLKMVFGISAIIFVCCVLVFGAVAGSIAFGLNSMKSTAVYQDAVTAASNNAEVIDALGQPIDTGMFFSGSVNVNDSSGDAEISIPLSGPNGKGTLYVQAVKTAGNWEYTILEVAIDGHSDRINLLSE